MKKITICFIALLLSFGGCRSLKETKKVATSSQHAQVVSEKYRVVGEWYDSTRRHWYYRADSSFYYHPDSGLFGNTGILWVQESMHKGYNARQSYDSISTQVQGNYTIQEQESVRVTKNIRLRYVILMVLSLFIICFLVWKVYRW